MPSQAFHWTSGQSGTGCQQRVQTRSANDHSQYQHEQKESETAYYDYYEPGTAPEEVTNRGPNPFTSKGYKELGLDKTDLNKKNAKYRRPGKN